MSLTVGRKWKILKTLSMRGKVERWGGGDEGGVRWGVRMLIDRHRRTLMALNIGGKMIVLHECDHCDELLNVNCQPLIHNL